MTLIASDAAGASGLGRLALERLGRLTLGEACALAFAAIAVCTAALAFVGLAVSNFWTDELFTLFLVDHSGGPGEVVRRALTDTHPPAYYLLLNAWRSVAGAGEVAMRAPSAVFAVTAVGVFALVARRAFSAPAVAFACALATTSPFWFFQAQNARNYALCMLLSALLMACAMTARARAAQGRSAAAAICALLAVGALGALSHFYALLTTGFVIGWLILTLPSWRARAGLAAGGLAILLADMAYIRLLTAHTEQNLQEMWFRNDASHLLGVIREVLRSAVASSAQSGVLLMILAVVVAALLRRPAPLVDDAPSEERAATRRWLLHGAWMTLGGVYLTGLAISVLFAPSLSDQNVLVAAPFLWLLWAGLYERAFAAFGPRVRPWIAVLLVALLAGQVTMAWHGRLLPRNEQWRASADYVASLPACARATIPVVRPYKFGPDTPFFRTLAQRDFFGRFLHGRPLMVRPPAAFMTPDADPAFARLLAQRANDPAACPVLAWAVHDFGLRDARTLRAAVSRLPGVAPGVVRLRVFSHYRRDGLSWSAQPSGYVLEAVR